MKRWQSIARLFDHREPATALACIRIGVGLVVLYTVISAGWANLVGVLWVDIEHGGISHVRGSWVMRLFGGSNPTTVYGLYAATAIGGMLLVVGLFSRFAALMTLLCYGALVQSHGHTSGGADLMTTNALWLLALSQCGATLSLSARLETGSFVSEKAVPAWPRYVFIFQIIGVYFMAGINKSADAWMPGGGYTALHFVLQDPTFTRFATDTFVVISPLTRIATAVTWHWEQLTPILFLYFYCRYTREKGGRLRRWVLRFDWRKPWVLIGISLHAGIMFTLNVGSFSVIAVTYYFALFRPDELAAAANRLTGRLRRRGQHKRSTTMFEEE